MAPPRPAPGRQPVGQVHSHSKKDSPVVQIVLYAGFGFLLALLFALVLAPVLRRRTVRLTERRMRAELPQSIAEIRAERDGLRAEYAMRERQLEIMLEKLKEDAVQQALFLEERSEEIYTLKSDVRQKFEIINELKDELDRLRDASREKDEEMSRLKARIRDMAGQLERKAAQLERAESRLSEVQDQIEAQRAELIEARVLAGMTDRDGSRSLDRVATGDGTDRIAGGPGDDAVPEIRVDGPRVDPGGRAEPRVGPDPARQQQLAALQSAAAAAESRASAAEQDLAAMERQLAALEQKIAEMERSETGEADAQAQARMRELQDRISQLEDELANRDSAASAVPTTDGEDAAKAKLRALEADRARFQAEVARLTLELEQARATPAAAKGKTASKQVKRLNSDLAAARDERDQALARAAALQEQLEAAQALQTSQEKIEQAEITLLRESLSELAADVTNLVMTLEGEDSPIKQIIADANGRDDGSGEMISLADRIKSLRERSLDHLPG